MEKDFASDLGLRNYTNAFAPRGVEHEMSQRLSQTEEVELESIQNKYNEVPSIMRVVGNILATVKNMVIGL